jgi:putative SOS response-associated peptidase YedK
MCERFALYSSPDKIQKQFDTDNKLDFEPHFNIAPAQSVPVIRTSETGKRVCVLARWGLIPSWMSDTDDLQKSVNAKAETAAIKTMFRHAYRNSRILVPADAFYEWALRNSKQPYLIRLKSKKMMGLGGLLERWHGHAGDIMTFTLLTTSANPLMTGIHERMPVIIKPEDYSAWLDGSLTDVTKIHAMTEPCPERLMEAYPVSREVNNPGHDSADLISPVEFEPVQLQPNHLHQRYNV